MLARSEFCSGTHHPPCCRCSKIQEVADTILKEEFIALHKAYQLVSPNTKSDIMVKAKRMLLQLPLVPITIGQPNSGAAFTLLVEHQQFLNYDKLSVMLLKCSRATTERINYFKKLL